VALKMEAIVGSTFKHVYTTSWTFESGKKAIS
jgi:hypothetical protein